MIQTSRQPQRTEELPETSLTEDAASATNQNVPPPLEEPSSARQPKQEANTGTVATVTATTKVQGCSPQALKSEHVEEEQRDHRPLNQLTTKKREHSAMGFNSDAGKAPIESKVRKESTKDAEANRYDIVAQKMQSRKLSQALKPSASDARGNDSEAGMSAFGKALRRASLQREQRMMQNKPRLTNVVELSLPNSEDNSESPSTKRVTSALLQKIESVTPLINDSPSSAEQKRYSDTSGWSDVDSPPPKMERAFKEDSEFQNDMVEAQERQGNKSVEGGGLDEEHLCFLPMETSPNEDTKK